MPRDVYEKYFSELEKLMLKGVGNSDLPNTQKYNQGGTLMETERIE
jgi:hypothetical protein